MSLSPQIPFDHTMPKRCHDLYVKLSGFPLDWSVKRIFAWECYCLRFTEDDLRIVIKFIKDKSSRGRPARSLTFRSLISGPDSLDFFEEELHEARALARREPPTPRAKLLASVGRPEVEPDRVKSAAQILAESKALADLQAFKASL